MSASVDAFEFHTTQRCHSVFSCFSPDAEFHERLVASENVATRLPPDVERTSGSAPRLPINVTLFRLRLTIPPGDGPLSITITTRSGARGSDSSRDTRFRCTRSQLQPQHDRVFDRFAVVPCAPRDRLESPQCVQCAGRDVRLTYLQKEPGDP